MIRLIGCAAVMLSCALAVSHISSVEKIKINKTETFISLIKRIRHEISCHSTPVEKILSSSKDILVSLGINKEITDFSQLISECEGICDNCEKVLKGFSASLGKGYREEEIKTCDAALSELENIRKKLAESYPVKRKTTAAVCFAAGGALLIALL